MPETHILLSAHQWKVKEPSDLIIKHTNHFGSFPFDNTTTFDKLLKLEKTISESKLQQWQRAIAEEILLAKFLDHQVPEAICHHFSKTLLSENPEVYLKDCLEKKGAMAVFPLASLNEKPSVVHAWWVEKVGPFFISATPWKGRSSELASKLAEKAVKKNAPPIIKKLATHWICTGIIEDPDQTIGRIKLGNKFDLDLHRPRKWLIPRENLKNITQEQKQNLSIQSADTLSTAWNIVSGEGTKSGEEKNWPDQIDELHMLVGGNIKAQVASVLLTPTRKKVVLWHSSNKKFSKTPAQEIQSICKYFNIPTEMYELSDTNIAKAEKELRNYFNKHNIQQVLFNITSGNRLMSYAVQTLAQLYPEINLIYREMGEKIPHRFIHLSYTEFPPYSGSYIGKPEDQPEPINWDFLYNGEKYSDKADFFQKLNS